jgi:crotonobetainyl-CoA:carnitine CoA-transferase CaiB-like acyl-CoA transferase
MGPLDGIRIVDLTSMLSGPWATMTTVQAGSDDRRPRLIRTVLPDKLTAVTAAQAIAAALVGRLKTGHGQHVRLSMLDAVLAFLWASDMGAQTYVGEKVAARTAASFIDLIYETRDGFMTAAVMTNKEWTALAEALGRPEWLQDARFKTPELRDQNIDVRLQMTQDVLKTRTTREWLERLEAEGVPCAPVLTREQVIEHPHVRAGNILLESDHPVAGRLRQTRTAARFETPTVIRHGAPRLGEHNEEILRELRLSEEEIAALHRDSVIGPNAAKLA